MRQLIVLLAALALAAGTARLGIWQLDRAAAKKAIGDAIARRGALPPLSGSELESDGTAAAEQQHRAVVLRGRWLTAHTVLLDNRQMNARPGFFVVTPFRLTDGRVLLVQRGWLPRDPQDRTRATPPALPEGEIEVAGRIAPPPSRLLELGEAASGPIRQNLDLAAFGRETGLKLLPLSALQLVGSDALQREWPQPALDLHKHHGYAFQWFALSALTVLLYVWFQLIRPRWRRAGR